MKAFKYTTVYSAYNEILEICKMNLENLTIGQTYTAAKILGEDTWYQFEPNDRKGMGKIIRQLADEGKLPLTYINTYGNNHSYYRLKATKHLYLVNDSTATAMPDVPEREARKC